MEMNKDYTAAYKQALKNQETIAIEISKQGNKSKAAAIKAGNWNIWTEERIKGAFSFGRGTIIDFYQYTENNTPYIWIQCAE